jgi:hypothetical protein
MSTLSREVDAIPPQYDSASVTKTYDYGVLLAAPKLKLSSSCSDELLNFATSAVN